jgi:hypothetical protein
MTVEEEADSLEAEAHPREARQEEATPAAAFQEEAFQAEAHQEAVHLEENLPAYLEGADARKARDRTSSCWRSLARTAEA